jgi:uncharacterized protein YjiS (DUF1127 family)
MIMSQSTTVDLRGEAGSGILTMPVAAMKRMCAAYIAWRMEKSAIAALRSMSDRALTDIGLARSDITSAVRGKAPRIRGVL